MAKYRARKSPSRWLCCFQAKADDIESVIQAKNVKGYSHTTNTTSRSTKAGKLGLHRTASPLHSSDNDGLIPASQSHTRPAIVPKLDLSVLQRATLSPTVGRPLTNSPGGLAPDQRNNALSEQSSSTAVRITRPFSAGPGPAPFQHCDQQQTATKPSLPQLEKGWDAVVSITIPKAPENSTSSSRGLSKNDVEDSDSPGPSNSQGMASSSVATTAGRSTIPTEPSLPPLDDPTRLLHDVIDLIDINDEKHILQALALVRRGAKHHATSLLPWLSELILVVVACLQSPVVQLVRVALTATDDMVRHFSDNLIRYIDNTADYNSVIVQLLELATARRLPSTVRVQAEGVLTKMAATLHQPSVVKILEHISTTHSKPNIRSKAASILLVATYRLS